MKTDNSGRNIAVGSIAVIIIIIVVASIMHGRDLKTMDGYRDAEIFRTDNEIASVVSIDVAKFKEIKESDKVSIIYYGRPTCPACVVYFPVLEEVSEQYNLDIFYINLDEWSRANANFATRVLNDFVGTPTTLIMFNGKQVAAEAVRMNKEELVEFLTEYNLIRDIPTSDDEDEEDGN